MSSLNNKDNLVNKDNPSVNESSSNLDNINNIIWERVNKLLTVNKALILNRNKESLNPRQVNMLNHLKRELREKYDIDIDDKEQREFYETLYKETAVIGIRVPLIVKYKYERIRKNPLLWIVFKDVFIELIERFNLYTTGEIKQLLQDRKKVNVNIELKPNIIMVKQEVRHENKQEVNIDMKILNIVNRLYKLVQNNPRVPPLISDLIRQLYNEVSR